MYVIDVYLNVFKCLVFILIFSIFFNSSTHLYKYVMSIDFIFLTSSRHLPNALPTICISLLVLSTTMFTDLVL